MSDDEVHVAFRENQTAYHHKHLIPTVKHGDGGIMIWIILQWYPLYTKALFTQMRGHLCDNKSLAKIDVRKQICNRMAEKDKNHRVKVQTSV